MEKIIITYDINEDILKLRTKVFVDEQGFSIEDELSPNENEYIHCALYNDDKIIAYARLHIENTKCHIQRVVVEKDYRRKGYGYKIMKALEKVANENNCNQLYLHSQLQAVDFYKKNGYVTVGDNFYECGVLHCLMIKDIN